MANGWQAGIDIGGTFTDVVAMRPASGEIRSAKVSTRIDDRVAGLKLALAAVGLEWSDVDDLIHGTTMVTNAIVENNLATVALVATEGFSDSLEIGRQNRRYLYNLDLPPKLEPQVPAERRFEVAERLDYQGHILKDLDLESIDEVIERILETGAEAVAVSLLHAYANPLHEETLDKRLSETFPYVALSNRVNPEAREYERTATTVLSASIMPLVAGYLDCLESAKPASMRLHLFHSAGGMASPAVLRDLPLSLATSGPAAGVAAAGQVAIDLGLDRVLSFDMGGTTTDVCLILDGKAQVSSDRSLGDRPMRQPMLAVEAIGAGGGSIARLDHGALCVGPESVGASPGPACYGMGGVHPTVSDANLVLGVMDSERIIGGTLSLDIEAARAVIATLAEAMQMSLEAAALGIVRVANSAMIRALRRITVERGIEGRACSLLAYGGAGPMHAVEVARGFGISSVVVPAHSGVFSALGCVRAEMSYAQQRSLRMAVGQWDRAVLAEARQSLRERLSAPLKQAGYTEHEMRVTEIAAIRYSGQSYAIEITAPTFDDPDQLGREFLDRHQALYGFASDEPWELVSIRQHVSIPRSGSESAACEASSVVHAPLKISDCFFNAGESTQTPRYDRCTLATDLRIPGPAIIEDDWSTVLIPPGASCRVDARGNLHIDVGVAP